MLSDREPRLAYVSHLPRLRRARLTGAPHDRATCSTARQLSAETIDDETLDWENGWKPRTSAHFLSSQKVDRRNPWVGLLTRKERVAKTTRGPLRLPRLSTEWLSKRRAFTHSGGTAPDSHRLPCYAQLGTQGERLC